MSFLVIFIFHIRNIRMSYFRTVYNLYNIVQNIIKHKIINQIFSKSKNIIDELLLNKTN